MTDTTWAAKVLADVPRWTIDEGRGAFLSEAEVLAAIAKLADGDGLVERLLDWSEFDEGKINDTREEAAARIAALTTQNQTWQRNSRETFDAMVAMRNSINEHLPMPSLESDLLQGPENSVFCAAVAEAVVSAVHRLRAKVARLEGQIKDWEARIDDCEWSANSSLTEGIRAEMRAALTDGDKNE